MITYPAPLLGWIGLLCLGYLVSWVVERLWPEYGSATEHKALKGFWRGLTFDSLSRRYPEPYSGHQLKRYGDGTLDIYKPVQGRVDLHQYRE